MFDKRGYPPVQHVHIFRYQPRCGAPKVRRVERLGVQCCGCSDGGRSSDLVGAVCLLRRRQPSLVPDPDRFSPDVLADGVSAARRGLPLMEYYQRRQ